MFYYTLVEAKLSGVSSAYLKTLKRLRQLNKGSGNTLGKFRAEMKADDLRSLMPTNLSRDEKRNTDKNYKNQILKRSQRLQGYKD